MTRTKSDGAADAPPEEITATAEPATVAADAPAADAAALAEEQPPHGGSWTRNEDGSLTLVERTLHPHEVEER